MGKILRVNLDQGSWSVDYLPERVLKKFVGGSGLAAYLASDFHLAHVDPLDRGSPLVFATGPLTGTMVPTSGRYAVAARSPLTRIWADSDSGGRFGIALKSAGFDALVITGRSMKPLVLVISKDDVKFEVTDLWGNDTYETFEALRKEFSDKAGIVCIGPAGEQMIPLANIMSEGYHARAAGRCGLGAVMGAKNLKAIVAVGNLRPIVVNSSGVREVTRRVTPRILKKNKRLRDFGTAGGVVGNAGLGDMSAKNWTIGNWIEAAERISGEAMASNYVVGRYNCPSCIIGCGKTVRVTRGKYNGTIAGAPEYETLAGFGAQCLVDDLELIIQANDLCNRWGLDTISVSGSIAFLLEAVEKGLLAVPNDYPPITWGNGEAVIFLLHEILAGQGLGQFLRQGVRGMATALGGEALQFALHVKGLEPPYHDPRALHSLAVAYATHPRGACHRGCSHNLERFAVPELGYPEVLDRFVSFGKGTAVAHMQNYAEMYNCLKVCQFIMSAVSISDLVELLNSVTGWNMSVEEFLRVGERSINLKRLINLSCGLTPEQDTCPDRLISEPFTTGSAAGHLPDLSAMLEEYYQTRGWNDKGVPLAETLDKLDLTTIWDKLGVLDIK